VTPRVSPTTRVRAEMDALFNSDRDLTAILEDVERLRETDTFAIAAS